MERTVHICNGTSTADTLALADLPGDIRVWADALDRGPLLPVADGEHYKLRGEYWASITDDKTTAGDHAQQLADWDRGFDEATTGGGAEVVLWFEHDLFDQLALVRLLARVARAKDGRLPTQLSIVSIDRHPDVPSFVGLGQLRPEQLAELWPRRTPLSRDAIDEAVTAWIAVTASDPRALPFLAKRIRALPFLAGALERHLEELPDPSSGLSRTERQVLAAIARREGDPASLIRASHATDPLYPLTDVVLASTMRTFARCNFTEADAITALGRQALAGAIDRVHECGIDDWRGGVRLSGRGAVWRWDSRERRLFER